MVSNRFHVLPASAFDSFGALLKVLRRRARLTQRDLSIATGYSEAQISRLETGQRFPDVSAVQALFLPALRLEDAPEIAARLIALAKEPHVDMPLEVSPTGGAPAAAALPPTVVSEKLPTGTVTFLFTDIVGSTSLWENQPAAMQAAVAQHHALLRSAIETNGGMVFQIIGDAFQAAFPTASQALTAALAIQRGLQSSVWGSTGPLRVRLGLHTGTAERDPRGDAPYAVSHTLNRAARVMSIGHGGQILLSQETADLVRRALPPGVLLVDLGEHHLKGMEVAEHLYQASAPDLPQEFPPLASIGKLPGNLPPELTSFVGRENELADLCQQFDRTNTRVVTLTGSGGCVKTRLALKFGATCARGFRYGVWLVELAPLSDPTGVPQAVVSALGLLVEGSRTTEEVLVDFLRANPLLLILDNCEHLIEAAAQLAGMLMRACPELRILATSREPLGLPGEVTCRIPSLELPPEGPQTLAEIERYSAARLFLERARSALPGYTPASAELPVLAQICRRVDGIPLAIELAAARVPVLSLAQMAARLEEGFRVLGSGSRGIVPRHQTLRAVVEWSYNLLSLPERVLLRRLPVFAGGLTLEAAEAVCAGAGVPQEEILDLLAALVNKSLVRAERGEGEVRYDLHEMVRQFAREKLEDAGERETTQQGYLDYFVTLAETAEPELIRSNQLVWMKRLEQEYKNLREALSWALEQKQADAALRMVGALQVFLERRYSWVEDSRAALAAVELGRQTAETRQSLRLAEALLCAGRLFKARQNITAVESLLQEALKIYQIYQDSKGIDKTWLSLGEMRLHNWDFIATQERGETALHISLEAGDHHTAGLSLFLLGLNSFSTENIKEARSFLERGSEELKQTEDVFAQFTNASLLVVVLWNEGDTIQAFAIMEAELPAARTYGPSILQPYLDFLAQALREMGDFAAAQRYYEESYALSRSLGMRYNPSYLLSRLGELAYCQGDLARARQILDSAIQESRANQAGALPWQLCILGSILLKEGRLDEAEALVEECITAHAEKNYRRDLYYTILCRANVALAKGDFPRAAEAFRESLTIVQERGMLPEMPARLEGLARLASAEGKFARSARLFAASAALRRQMANPIYPVDRQEIERCLQAARSGMTMEAFQNAWEWGESEPLEAVVRYALEEDGEPL